MSNKKIKKDSETFPATDLPAYYSQVLEKWTKLVNLEEGHKDYKEMEQLISTITGRPEYHMEIENTLVSLEMLSSQGTNSFVYLVKTYGYTNEAILKHFKTSEGIQSNSTESKSSETRQHTYRTEPKLEAKLQKYAHAHDLAPEVFAFNDVAMISDKCFDFKYKIQKCFIPTYGKNTWNMCTEEMSELKRADFVLQEWFNPFTDQILNLVDTMYEQIGMYNMDPNGGNYMLNQTGTLIQIDYGANRFDKQEAFDAFAVNSNTMYSFQKELLLEDQPTYPPYFYWFSQKLGEGIIVPELIKLPTMTKLRGMDKGKWQNLLSGLRKQKIEICDKIKALQKNPTTTTTEAIFRTHVVRKF